MKTLDPKLKQQALAFIEQKFRRTRYFDFAYTAANKLKGIKLAQYIIDLFNSSRKLWLVEPGMEIACKRGCAYCCYLKVDIVKFEAMYLAKHIKKNFTKPEIKVLKEKAIEWMAKYEDKDSAWFTGKFIPCILLDTEKNECTAYEARPMSCRRLYSYRVDKCESGYQGLTDDNAWWGQPYEVSENINGGYAYAMLENDTYEEFTIASGLAKYL